MSTDLFSLFGNLLGGTASLPYQRSVSNNLPFSDALFNAFQNRQGLFSSSPTVSGVKQATTALPFNQQLKGGGLAWSYDPAWMTGLPKPRPQGLAGALGGGHGHGGGWAPDDGPVHGGPAQPPVELEGGFGPVSPTSPMPAPLNGNGHWVWEWNREAPGTGKWVWQTNVVAGPGHPL